MPRRGGNLSSLRHSYVVAPRPVPEYLKDEDAKLRLWLLHLLVTDNLGLTCARGFILLCMLVAMCASERSP